MAERGRRLRGGGGREGEVAKRGGGEVAERGRWLRGRGEVAEGGK